MPHWLIEHGIGETRAALIDGDRIIAARIEPDDGLRAGTVLPARLVRRLPERNQGIVAWAEGEALLSPLPPRITEGALLLVEITRPALPEPGKPKRARARPAIDGAAPRPGPVLADTLEGEVRTLDPFAADMLEATGWSELLEEAATGIVTAPDCTLAIALTPAMTLIDVDGTTAPPALAVAGAAAAGRAIRRLDIAGSIGIDLPTSGSRTARLAAATAFDTALPLPFERTAVNGFGFLHVIRKRSRLSLPELYATNPAAAHARALIRRAERTPGTGERTLTAHPALIAEIGPAWLEELTRRIGTAVILRGDAALAISAGHVQARHP